MFAQNFETRVPLGVCDQVRRNMYSDFFQQGQGSSHNDARQEYAAVKSNLLVELSPEFEAQDMRPTTLEASVIKTTSFG